MDYTEQFIRLNCSLMSDYKMMKLNAEMKCMGIGLYIQMILFLRRQQEYKHDFNELDLLAEQWGATVENLQHLIKDFNLFVITEEGYFRCLYLDEVMGYQNKLSEQRAAAGSKGGRSSKKKTAQIAEKVITSTVLVAADKEADDEANNKENGAKCMKNTIEKINMTLRTYTGGYLRFEQDHYCGGTSPWPIATLWMAMYYQKAGERKKAKENSK